MDKLQQLPLMFLIRKKQNQLPNEEKTRRWLPAIIFLYTNNKIIKIRNYETEVVSCFYNTTFREHFRLTISAFESLLEMLSPHWDHIIMNGNQPGGNEHLSLKKTLLLSLWVFATPDSYRSVAERFDVGKSTVYLSIMRTIYLVNGYLCPYFVKWPTPEERLDIAAGFEEKTGFPQVIGCIDGCHIPIRRPIENGNDYFNRKKFYSVVLQGICKQDLSFTDVDCRWPGSVHDARVFRTSSVFPHLENLCSPDFFILGDAAYPCLPYIMPPFKNNGHLTRQKLHYNTTLSKARVCIENAFALLKGRFRRLKYLEMYYIDEILNFVVCCCVLHNICLLNEDNIQDFLDEGLQAIHLVHDFDDYGNVNMQIANNYRQQVVDYLWNRRNRN